LLLQLSRGATPGCTPATSAINPVNMGRSIELTGLAHRKHYRTIQSIDSWLK